MSWNNFYLEYASFIFIPIIKFYNGPDMGVMHNLHLHCSKINQNR